MKKIMNNKTTIIPIASGKGGVGKSLLTANLSIALAMMGHSTVAVDLDLGGSNLHTYLGVPNKYPGIGDYLKAEHLNFNDLIIETDIPDLKFLPGDGKTPFMANISYNQRLIILKKLRQISAKYVILDLGAGTVFNTLNFYELTYKGMIITTFEISSIMNFMMFLKNFMFRIISSAVHQDKKVFDMVTKAFQQPIESEPLTVKLLIDKISAIDTEFALKAQKICTKYRPAIIFNMGNHPDELNVLKTIDSALKRGLSTQAEYMGFIFFDESVRKSAQKREVLVIDYPNCIASQCIKQIAKRVGTSWDRLIENSGAMLMKDTEKKYAEMKNQ
ncbi:Mad29 [Candidatus Magnetomoraceae bacterium gMMP-15]